MASYKTGPLPLHMVEQPPFTVEVPGAPKIPGETIPRRHPRAANGLVTRPAPDVRTTFDLLRRSAARFPNEPAVGSRKLVRLHKEMRKVVRATAPPTTVEKEWTYFELSDYGYLTYREYEAAVLDLGAGLRKLGLGRGDKLHIFAATSQQWLSMAHASASQSITIVTAYDTLGESGVEHSLLRTKADAMFIDPHLLATATNPLTRATSVKVLIYNDSSYQQVPDSQLAAFKSAHPDLTVVSFSELQDLGAAHPTAPTPPEPEDVFCIMYTSGTTSAPKGVPMTHAGLVAAVAGLWETIGPCVSPAERVLAYLPLAHSLELVVENLVIFLGATLGYGSARTLADTSMRHCRGDMRTFAPTVMVGVPQVWETIRKGVVAQVSKAGAVQSALFWAAVRVKDFLVSHNLPGQSLLDGLVFGAVRRSAGGRLRFVFNGATGIAPATLRFLSLVLAPMIQGYGLTETCGCGALGSPLQWTSDAIGPVPASVEVKLVAVPELGYCTDYDNDSKGQKRPPRGEILIRGAPVLHSYWTTGTDEEPSSAGGGGAITADGWFHTGDIGEFDPRTGHLRVVDRLKNLVKLLGGEYVALEKLESVYRGAHAVRAVMVHGDAAHSRPVAVVLPDARELARIASGLGTDAGEGEGEGAAAAYRDPRVRAAVLRELRAVAKAAGLESLETVAGVVLVDGDWTPANGLVTATQKVNRRVVEERYKKEIEECFASAE